MGHRHDGRNLQWRARHRRQRDRQGLGGARVSTLTDFNYKQPDRDRTKAHPLLRPRLSGLIIELAKLGYPVRVEEIYRPELRQQWLWAQGRTVGDCIGHGIPREFARPGPIVTNAWSAKLSAHGLLLNGLPAAAAGDLVVVGEDGKPWTADDPWDDFVGDLEPVINRHGLRHFHKVGPDGQPRVWDKPHIQMVEWDDATHTLKVAA